MFLICRILRQCISGFNENVCFSVFLLKVHAWRQKLGYCFSRGCAGNVNFMTPSLGIQYTPGRLFLFPMTTWSNYSTFFIAKCIGLLAKFQNVACSAVSLVCSSMYVVCMYVVVCQRRSNKLSLFITLYHFADIYRTRRFF